VRQKLAAEAIGSFMLFATVIGSGIMAESLAGGNMAVALLGNTLATGAMLFVLITMLGPVISGCAEKSPSRRHGPMSRPNWRAAFWVFGRRMSC